MRKPTEVGIEPTPTVLETIVLPLNYSLDTFKQRNNPKNDLFLFYWGERNRTSITSSKGLCSAIKLHLRTNYKKIINQYIYIYIDLILDRIHLPNS